VASRLTCCVEIRISMLAVRARGDCTCVAQVFCSILVTAALTLTASTHQLPYLKTEIKLRTGSLKPALLPQRCRQLLDDYEVEGAAMAPTL
jgi:hypothetical protein